MRELDNQHGKAKGAEVRAAQVGNEAPTPQDPLEVLGSLAQEGRFYDAFRTWFHLEPEQRHESWRKTLTALEESGKSYRSHRRDVEADAPGQAFLLNNLPVLTDPLAAKIFGHTEGEPLEIEEDEFHTLNGDQDYTSALMDVYEEVGRDFFDAEYVVDLEDFAPPHKLIRRNFSTEDVRTLLRTIIPAVHLRVYETDKDRTNSPYPWDLLVDPTRHQDLLEDPELAPFVARRLTLE